MKIVMSSEISGFPLKQAVKKYLIHKGYDIIDIGWQEGEAKINYVQAGERVAPYIQSGECERGLVFCGSAAGVSVTANKCKGIYCVASESLYTSQSASLIINANVLAVGAKVVADDNACKMCEAFLNDSFCNEFDEEKSILVKNMFKDLQELENKNFK